MIEGLDVIGLAGQLSPIAALVVGLAIYLRSLLKEAIEAYRQRTGALVELHSVAARFVAFYEARGAGGVPAELVELIGALLADDGEPEVPPPPPPGPRDTAEIPRVSRVVETIPRFRPAF